MDTLLKKQVILKPILSEKSLNLYKMNKICTLSVDPKSTKKDISYAFAKIYDIQPTSIRTVVSRKNAKSRDRKTYKTTLTRSYVKKAYIGIGDKTFDLYENIK